jgi:hypothetical protein
MPDVIDDFDFSELDIEPFIPESVEPARNASPPAPANQPSQRPQTSSRPSNRRR